MVDIDHKRGRPAAGPRSTIRQLLTNRMMLGVFFGQYFLNTITWFFLTWFSNLPRARTRECRF